MKPLPPHRPTLSRRAMLQRASTGFGLLALNAMCARASAETSDLHPAARRIPRAKSVIFCYMSGGVSHVDSFDPKPRLQREAGQPLPMRIERTMFNNNGNVFPTPFKFQRHGESGLWISSMFPEIAEHADELAVVRSMTSEVNEHAQANYFFHTGFPFAGHPSAGAWVSYGLGSRQDDLPSFAVLRAGGAVGPIGGPEIFSNAYLPGEHRASVLQADRDEAVRGVVPSESLRRQRSRLDFLEKFDQAFVEQTSGDPKVEASIRNFETACRMQTAVPELCDLAGESEATRKLYGLDASDREKAAYARQALMARRLVERGVRFVELSCLTKGIGAGNSGNPWDQHSDLERGHGAMAFQVDQPIAALLSDLKSRGLLDETLVVWAGEFGRTPFSQGSNGRDHNPYAFSIWLAGAGIRGGTVIGETDEYGYHVVDRPFGVHDLWATVLHLVGLDPEALTYRYAGRDFRLIDVHGRVIRDILI